MDISVSIHPPDNIAFQAKIVSNLERIVSLSLSKYRFPSTLLFWIISSQNLLYEWTVKRFSRLVFC